MMIQNNLNCSTIVSFQALAVVQLRVWRTQFLVKGLWVQVSLSEKIFGNFFVSFQIKDSDYQYLYL